MNSFTAIQTEVIESLAKTYWELFFGLNMPKYQWAGPREQYINDIIAGLKDPAIWGNEQY